MQSAIVNAICPLCRLKSADAGLNSTRLCYQCRSMLEPITPKTKPLAVVSAPELQVSPAAHLYQPHLAVAEAGGNGHNRFAEPVIPAAPPVPEPFDFDSSIDESDFIEEIEDGQKLSYTDLEISFDPAEAEFDYEAEPEQMPALAEQPFEIDGAHETQDESLSFARTNDALIETEQAEVFHFAEPSVDEAIESQTPGDLSNYVESEVINEDEQALDEAREIGAQEDKAVNYLSATDPWDDPLPAWDQSRNEWPIMRAPQKPSSMKKLRVLLGIATVIAIGAAAYFLFLQRPADTALPKQSSATQKSPFAALTPETEKAKTAASEPTTPQASAPAETTESAQPVRETTETMSEGRFTLQLASMPNEAAANEMADGLKSNGLPAYVARANLGSRGTWYRVRVGKFQTAEDAKNFAAKSRLEARVERTDN